MAKTALIAGVSGQDGAYLSQLLLGRGYRVFGQVRCDAAAGKARLLELGIAQDIEFVALDLLNINEMRRELDKLCPDEIYNLAGSSSVAQSFDQPMIAVEINALAAARLLEALRHANFACRFFQASTSEMFGNAIASPQNESTPFRPRSPYAVAKAFAHWQTVSYRETYNFFGACGIMFNHESPLRSRRFVTRKITAGLTEVKHGRRQRILLGNLGIQRDWGYARDYVDGMWRILQHQKPGDFVLATGISTSVRTFAERAAATLGMPLEWSGHGPCEVGIDRKSSRTVIEVSPTLFRPAEVVATVGDARRARSELAWRPSVDINSLIAMMVEADERRLLENRPLD